MKQDEAVGILAGQGWLSNTPKRFHEEVLSRVTCRSAPKGADIYMVGDEPGGLWGLAQGSMIVDYVDENLSQSMAFYARPGFWIGQWSVVTGTPRVVGIRTTQECTLLRLSRSSFYEIASRDGEAWRWLSLLTLEHLMLILGLTNDLRAPTSRRKVAAVLYRIATQPGSGSQNGPGPVDIHLSQDELAGFVGLSRASLAETLRSLMAEGIVKLGYRHMTLVDLPRLREIFAETASPLVN